MDLFFENPTTHFHLRELSRLARLSMPSIISVTDTLSKNDLIIKTKGKVLTSVIANLNNKKFLRYKRLHNLEMMYASGIVDYLTERYNHPKLIILFGSFSRGEDTENSDIDIAIYSNKKISLEFHQYEKFLKRRISIHEIDINKVSDEFRANLSNGIIMEGSW